MTDPRDLPLLVLDVEASALVDGYPIEIGICRVADATTRSWLIRPPLEWRLHMRWDPAAEAVHGITLRRLVDEGGRPEEVYYEVAAAVAGYRVVSDAASLDAGWLLLFSGYCLRPPICCLEPFYEVAHDLSGVGWPGLPGIQSNPVVDAAVDEVRRRYGADPEHRAASDARRLAEVLRVLLGIADGGDDGRW